MEYNFDSPIVRMNTSSLKWDYCKEIFGRPDVLPLWVADMDFAIAPEITQALHERIQHPIFGYSRRPESYNEALIGWFAKHHQWSISSDSILATPGVVPALYYAVCAYTRSGDNVLVCSPIYRPFYQAIEYNKRVVVTSPLVVQDGLYTIDFTDLENKMATAKLFLFCSPHNPVGRVWTTQELEKIGKLCQKHHVIIVSDEIHCDLVYKPHKHIPTAIATPELGDITVSCVSPSKTFNIPSFKNAAVIIKNPELRQAYQAVLQMQAVNCENILSFVAGEAAYRHGETWYAAMMNYLEANRLYALDYITRHWPKISCMPPQGTFLLWLDMNGLRMSHEELREWLIQEVKIGLEDGIKFGNEGNGFQRLNFACSRKVLQIALEKISKGLCQISESSFRKTSFGNMPTLSMDDISYC